MGLGSLVQCQSYLVLLEVLLNAWVCHGHSSAAILGWAQLGHQSLGGFPFLQICMGRFNGFWLFKEPRVFKGGMLVTNAFELVNFGAMLFVIHIPEPGNNMTKKRKLKKIAYQLKSQGAMLQSSSGGFGVGQPLWGWLSACLSPPKPLLWLAPLGR